MSSKEIIRFRFNGPAVDDKLIDVNDLAPSLLALGDLCKEANHHLNHGKVLANVRVRVDSEQNCFELDVELALTAYDAVKEFVFAEKTQVAKEVLEWLGLLGVSSGFIWFIKKIGFRTVSNVTFGLNGTVNLELTDEKGKTQIIETSKTVYELYEETECVKHVQKLIRPLENEGFSSLEFEYKSAKNITKTVITKEDAKIINSHKKIEEIVEDEPQTFTAYLRLHSPVFEEDSSKWQFKLNGKIEWIDISETNLAREIMKQGYVSINDTFKVKMEMTQGFSKSGRESYKYKILDIIEHRPGANISQLNLFKK